jgi:hypothetical protein
VVSRNLMRVKLYFVVVVVVVVVGFAAAETNFF